MTGTELHQRYRNTRFFGSLNGLRFLCILAVMWHHSPAHGSLEGAIRVLQRGFAGVDFFFILSGFLITTLLLREEARTGRFSLIGFYWRRILRIVPVYFLVITAVSGYYVFVVGRNDLMPLVPYYYLFLSNFLISDIPLLSITWSLGVEEQYYVLWPALLLLLPMIGRVRIFVLVALIALCVLTALGLFGSLDTGFPSTEHAKFVPPVSSYVAILIGSLLALSLHHPKGFLAIYRLCGWSLAPLVAFGTLLVLFQVMPGVLTGWPNLLIHATMALCLASIVVREDNAFRRFLMFRPIARVGEISYGLYLYHLIGLHLGNALGHRLGLSPTVEPWVITVLFMLSSVAIAELSFRFFESQFLKFKERGSLRGHAQRS